MCVSRQSAPPSSHLSKKIAPVEGTNYEEKNVADALGRVASSDITIAHRRERHRRDINGDHVRFHLACKDAAANMSRMARCAISARIIS